MTDLATPTVNPAATCPEWCIATHEGDVLVPTENDNPDCLAGEWFATHEGAEDVVYIDEDEPMPPGFTNNILVRPESFTCSTPGRSYPRSISLQVINNLGGHDTVTISARQAVGLAEVLLQHAAAILAEQGRASEVTR